MGILKLFAVIIKKHLGETKPDPTIPSISPSSVSMREEVAKLFKELREIMDKFSTQLIALLAVTEANTLFKNQHKKLMMFMVLIIVVYYLMLVVRTVVVHLLPQNCRLLPIILTFIVIALFGSSASVLALVITS